MKDNFVRAADYARKEKYSVITSQITLPLMKKLLPAPIFPHGNLQ
jgi:hypothetical protein